MEIIKKKLCESRGKTITVFLKNDFRFTGKCLNSDDKYLEILDYKTENIRIFEIHEIKEFVVENAKI